MVEIAVALPEPRPDDDEDVVWGLSTAAALWARGERGDAIVWVRRAAEAAASAGAEERAGALVGYAIRMEQAHAEHRRDSLPPPPLADAGPLFPEGASLRAAPVPDRSSLGIEVELEATPEAQVGAELPPSEPAVDPAAASVEPPSPAAPPRPPRGASAAPAGKLSLPVTPDLPPPRGPLPSYTFLTRPRVVPRTPILDPWAEDATLPSIRVAAPVSDVHIEGDQVLVQMRRPVAPRGATSDDEDVVTSAAPLEVTLRRASKPPPPPPPPRKSISPATEQAPGQVTDATSVPPKMANRPPPPPPPRGPATTKAAPGPASEPPPGVTGSGAGAEVPRDGGRVATTAVAQAPLEAGKETPSAAPPVTVAPAGLVTLGPAKPSPATAPRPPVTPTPSTPAATPPRSSDPPAAPDAPVSAPTAPVADTAGAKQRGGADSVESPTLPSMASPFARARTLPPPAVVVEIDATTASAASMPQPPPRPAGPPRPAAPASSTRMPPSGPARPGTAETPPEASGPGSVRPPRPAPPRPTPSQPAPPLSVAPKPPSQPSPPLSSPSRAPSQPAAPPSAPSPKAPTEPPPARRLEPAAGATASGPAPQAVPVDEPHLDPDGWDSV